jgi:hypothetical protein
MFSHHGKLHTFTIGKVKRNEAENKARQVDYLLMRLKQRLIVMPDGTDIVTFIEHDGKPPAIGPTLADAPRQTVTLGYLKDRYLTTHANGTIEANSLDTCKLHLGHFCRILGASLPMAAITLDNHMPREGDTHICAFYKPLGLSAVGPNEPPLLIDEDQAWKLLVSSGLRPDLAPKPQKRRVRRTLS